MFEVPLWVMWLLFGTSLIAIGAIFALSLFALVSPDFRFFPPPSKESWQHRTFLMLFRLFLYPLILLSVLIFIPEHNLPTTVRYVVGGLLFLIGFGFAFGITARMGWRNAFGEKRGLVTSGAFKYSRNPVYVATWVGLVGWGLIVSSLLVSILLTLWALLYVFAPNFEEPWLEAQYGEDYREYRLQTRRFL